MSEIINIFNNNQEAVIIAGIAILIFFFAWNIYLSLSLKNIKKKTRSFFSGKQSKDLEEVIYNQIKNSNKINENIDKIYKENEEIRENIKKCIQKVGVVRFNPFGDVGGNQSFAIALLDNSLSGVIILSLYSRDGVKVYSKQIIEGKSEYKLSEEEEKALAIASNS
ncbi:MAG: DUF4446 family protein [Candidatus Pacebacteria bacterium]|nr:DUF4446 family protein [Candidatus Paceibacterota bacterium]